MLAETGTAPTAVDDLHRLEDPEHEESEHARVLRGGTSAMAMLEEAGVDTENEIGI
jgi:hypothetical protein